MTRSESMLNFRQVFNDFRSSKVMFIGLFLLVLGSLMFEYKAVRFICLGASLGLQIPFLLRLNPRVYFSIFGLYGLYLILCLISVSWSVDWIKSLGKISELVVGFVWVSFALSRGPSVILKLYRFSIFLIFTMLALSFLLYCIGLESFVSQYMYSILGVKAIANPYIGTNGVGLLAAMIALVLFAEYQTRPSKLTLGLISFCLLMMFLAYSRTSFVALILGLVLILSQSLKRTVLMSVMFGLFGLFFGIEFLIDFFHRGQSSENILSGRPELWSLAFDEFLNAPWFGYGYGVGSAFAVRDIFFNDGKAAGTAHNGLLEVMLGIGIFGACLLSLVFIYSSISFFKLIRNEQRAVYFASYPVMFCSSIMNTGVSGWFSLPMLTYLIMLAHLSLLPRQSRRKE